MTRNQIETLTKLADHFKETNEFILEETVRDTETTLHVRFSLLDDTPYWKVKANIS